MDAGQLARITLGFIFTPVIALALTGVGVCAVGVARSLGLNFSLDVAQCTGQATFILAAFGSMVAYPAAVVFGIPLFLLFRRRRWLHWWQVPLGGVALGLMAAPVLYVLFGSTLVPIFVLMLTGLIGGATFWALALYRSGPLMPTGVQAEGQRAL